MYDCMNDLTLCSVPDKADSQVGDLHPGDAHCPEVRVDGGELAPDLPELEHGPQGSSQVLAGRFTVPQHIIHGHLALDRLCGGGGEGLHHLGQGVDISLPAPQCPVIQEEEALGRLGVACYWGCLPGWGGRWSGLSVSF